jgi:hypothetical protein
LISRRGREGLPNGSVRQRLAAGTSVALMPALLAPITRSFAQIDRATHHPNGVIHAVRVMRLPGLSASIDRSRRREAHDGCDD